MKQAIFSSERLYSTKQGIRPTKHFQRVFLLLHLCYGILHFPLYLMQDYGTVLPTVIFLLQHIIYPLTAVLGFVGVVSNFASKNEENKKNPLRFLGIVLLGETISSFLVALIERMDVEGNLYYWYVILGNALLDTVRDIFYLTFALTVLYFVLWLLSKKQKENKANSLSVAVGIWCAVYLFGSEIVSTVYFLIEVSFQVYLNEALYILLVYAVYAVAACACYHLTLKGTLKVLGRASESR